MIHFSPLTVRQLGTGALFLLAYFVAILVALHFLRPDYAPARHMISDYAVGPYGWFMTSAFLALGVCCLLLMLGLASAGPRSIAARFGTALYGVAFGGLVITAIFPTDLPGAPATTSGDIHNATFLLNVGSLLLATVFLTASFGRDPTWRPLRRAAAVGACLVVAAFGLQFYTLRPGAPYGLANRVFVVALLSWLSLVAHRLRVLGAADAQSRATAA